MVVEPAEDRNAVNLFAAVFGKITRFGDWTCSETRFVWSGFPIFSCFHGFVFAGGSAAVSSNGGPALHRPPSFQRSIPIGNLHVTLAWTRPETSSLWRGNDFQRKVSQPCWEKKLDHVPTVVYSLRCDGAFCCLQLCILPEPREHTAEQEQRAHYAKEILILR